MDSESGCCAGGVSSDPGVLKFLKPESLVFQSLKTRFSSPLDSVFPHTFELLENVDFKC